MELILTRGIPASGKTTWAREWVKGGKRLLVSRDDLRNMFGEYWVPARESLITNIEEYIVATALESGYDVVVHDCNIRQFEIDIHTAIVRDENREQSVGAEVI